MLGMASRAWPKNSRHTVRVCFGMRCRIQRAAVIKSVAALLLHARQAAQEFVGDVLAEPDLAKFRALDVEPLAAQYLRLVGGLGAVLPDQFEARDRGVVNLAQIVIRGA